MEQATPTVSIPAQSYQPEWGPGERAKTEKPFRTSYVGGGGGTDDPKLWPVGLVHGEHPHQRRDNRLYARGDRNESIYEFDGVYQPYSVTLVHRNHVSKGRIREGIAVQFRLLNEPDKIVFETGGGTDPLWAFIWAFQKWERLRQFPWFPDHLDELTGKHVLYGNKICRIKYAFWPDAEIVLVPLTGTFPPARYLDGPEDCCYDDDRTEIKDTIFSDSIWWYPKAWHYEREGLPVPGGIK